MEPFKITVELPGVGKKKTEKVNSVCFHIDIQKGRKYKVRLFVYVNGAFTWVDSERCSFSEQQLKVF